MNPIDQAWNDLRSGNVEKGLELLKREVQKNPFSSKTWFELAGAYDYLGKESEALPFYEKVIELGIETLSKEDQPKFFVQMGSTLRNLKQFERAIQVLKEGLSQFPGNQALECFLSLAEYSAGDYSTALERCIKSLILVSQDRYLQEYKRALLFYAEDLKNSNKEE